MWGGALALRVFQMFIGLFFLEGRKSYLLSIYIYHITLIGNWKNSQFLFSTFAPRALGCSGQAANRYLPLADGPGTL